MMIKVYWLFYVDVYEHFSYSIDCNWLLGLDLNNLLRAGA